MNRKSVIITKLLTIKIFRLMKKYLMTGMAAIAFCAAFTSCSKGEDLYDQGAIEQQKELAVKEAYATAFEKAFGKVGENVDWGFGSSRSNTRATGEFANHVGAYPDANMWTSKGFLAPDPLTHAQKLRAQYYFQMNKIENPNRPDNGTKDFFMQQVYDGGTDPMAGKSLEVYNAADGNTKINSGEHMDHLTCGPDHTHTYNFNNGTCSTNSNVANRDQTDVNNTAQQHSDEIQLMLNTKTSCFGYANSDASYVRDDRWTLVSATTIDNFCDNDPGFATWLASKLNAGEVDKKCDDDFHRSFIGFDFDQLPSDKIYAGDPVDANGNIIYDLYNHGNEVDHINYHYYTLNGVQYHYLKAEQNQYCGEFQTIDPEPNATRAAELIAEGWLPVYNSANKKWVKVGGCADGYYSDWIVTFMPADSDPVIHYYRVIAEDLEASEYSDFDFNDVVFDVIPNATKDAAKIVLRAAGGIYKLTVAGREVHEAFGQNADANGLYPMINTNPWDPDYKVTLFEDLDGNFSDTAIRNTIKGIEIKVYKPGFENGIELEAQTGKAACKILVDDTFTVVTERTGIADKNVNFHKYVQGYFTGTFWWKEGNAPQSGN